MELVAPCPACARKLLIDFVQPIRHALCPNCETGLAISPPASQSRPSPSDKKDALVLATSTITWHVQFNQSHVSTPAAREKLLRDVAVGDFGLKYQLYLKKSSKQNVRDILPEIVYNTQDESAFLTYTTGYVRPDINTEMLAYLRQVFRPFAAKMG